MLLAHGTCDRVSSSRLGPVVPSFRALSVRLKFTFRRHKFNKDSLSTCDRVRVQNAGCGVQELGFRDS